MDTIKCGVWDSSFAVLFSTSRAELHDSLHVDTQGLELLLDFGIKHAFAYCLDKSLASVFQERESVKAHNFAFNE
jgi:hypothetical protein